MKQKRRRRGRRVNWGRLAVVFGLGFALVFGLGFGVWKGISLLLPKPQPKVVQKKDKEQPVEGVLVTVTGDILLEQSLIDYLGNWSWNSYTEAVADLIQKDDLTISTLNGAAGGNALGVSGTNGVFNAPDNAPGNMKAAGIDFLALAAEHANDMGTDGIYGTHANLDQAGIAYTGTALDQQERDTPKIVTAKDLKIGIVSYTFGSNVPIEDGFSVNLYDEEAANLINDVKLAKGASDAVIVCIHWGDLYSTAVNDRQRQLAGQLADAGATVIVGNYPEVIQPAEWVTGENGDKALCFYSLGNFISGDAGFEGADETAQNLYQMGALAQFELVKTDKGVSVKNPEIYPIVNHFQNGFKEFRLIRLKDYTDSLSILHDQAYYSSQYTKTWLQSQADAIFANPDIAIEK